MARQLSSLLLAAAMLPLLNCGGSAHDPNESYYLVATNVKVPYWQQAAAGLNKAATQMQVRAEMVGPDSYDPQAQHEAFVKALGKKPSGILVSVADPNILKGDIDNAIGQGVPVIAIDSDSPTSKRLFFIGTDNHNAGVMGAKVLADKLHGKGNVVVYTINGQANLAERMHGYKDVLDGYPGIKIADTVDMKGDARIAFDRTMEMMDKNAKVDAFICLEAIACPEVSEVLDRKKASGKVVVAMDTDQRTLEAIQKGSISATIGQRVYTMAYFGMQLIDGVHHHPPSPLDGAFSKNSFSPLPMAVDTGAILIDKSNVDRYISERNSATQK